MYGMLQHSQSVVSKLEVKVKQQETDLIVASELNTQQADSFRDTIALQNAAVNKLKTQVIEQQTRVTTAEKSNQRVVVDGNRKIATIRQDENIALTCVDAISVLRNLEALQWKK
jgi:hypothetical protein